ncbi:MAG TPA: ligand-binding protein SH3, partial [Stenotrophomonas sp.]|nr:ligand-binding protein SH3 [Stenotrophomonas sp.]
VAFRDRLEESTYAAREKRGTQGAVAPVASSAPRAQPVAVSGNAQQGSEATTQPLQPATTEPAPQQGFQPVSEGEIRTESLDGGN